MCASVAAYSHDLVSWCEIKTPVVHFSKLFGVEGDMLDSFVEDGGPLQTVLCMCASFAAYSHDLVLWCEIKTPVVHFSKLFGVEGNMLDSSVEDGGPLQTFALENSLMSENAFCQMMGTKDEFETRTESKVIICGHGRA